MADYHQQRYEQQLSTTGSTGRTAVYASLAGVAVGGPLLGMMGFSFLATVTLVIISSPLLLIFSPLLFCVGFVLVGALIGFLVAATMAIAGLYMLSWIYREIGGHVRLISGGGVRGKEKGSDLDGFGNDLQQERLINVE